MSDPSIESTFRTALFRLTIDDPLLGLEPELVPPSVIVRVLEMLVNDRVEAHLE